MWVSSNPSGQGRGRRLWQMQVVLFLFFQILPSSAGAIELAPPAAPGPQSQFTSIADQKKGVIALAVSLLVGMAWIVWRRQVRAQLLAKAVTVALQSREMQARKMALIANHTDNALIILDREGGVEWVNAGFTRMTGYSAAAALGKKLVDILPASDADQCAQLHAALVQGEGFKAELDTRKHSGEGYCISLEVRAIDDEGAGGFAVVATDITRRLRAEQELRRAHDQLEQRVEERTSALGRANVALQGQIAERTRIEAAMRVSEGRLRSILDNTTSVIYAKDLDGRYLMVNRRFEALFGIAGHDAEGKTDHDLFPQEMADGFKANDRRVLEAGTPLEFEESARPMDGERTYLSVKFPLYDAAGAIYGLCGISTDISERKQIQLALQKAKEAAEAASRAKSQFLATMSHEIRTPLNGVIGMTDLLLVTDLSEQQRRYADLVKSSGESLGALVNDILDFSKIEAGKLELETVDFDLRHAIEEVMGMLSRAASQKGLEIGCHIHPDLPALFRGDEDRLRQILINLLNNAIKFTDNGAVVIRVAPEPDAGDDVMIRFGVTDTGVGIPQDRLDRLFKAFSQVDASTTRRYGGTGLGLAISKQLAELMGGRIGVESMPGQGSTFWFTARLRRPAGGQPAGSPGYATLAGLRALVVAAKGPHLDILHEQLINWGCNARAATSAADALDLVNRAAERGEPFDIAVLDVDTPGMSGIELGDAIRRASASVSTKMLLLTPMGREANASIIRAVGFAGAVGKPVRQSELFDALTSAIASDGPSRAAEVPLDCAEGGTPVAASDEHPPRRLRVLVAEDNRVNQIVVGEILSRFGHEYDVVNDGRKVLEALDRGPAYDLVLMDCQMPEMDGFETTRAIRLLEQSGRSFGTPGKPVPVIALTANAIKGDRERCLAAGMDDYISKPIDRMRLQAAIQALAFERSIGADPRPFLPPDAADAGPEDGRQECDQGGNSAPAAAPFDIDVLLERCLNSAATVRLILEEFPKQFDHDLTLLEQSLRSSDHEEARKAAHTMKGTAGILTAEILLTAASRLEHVARAGGLEESTAEVKALRAEVSRCLAYLPSAHRLLEERENFPGPAS